MSLLTPSVIEYPFGLRWEINKEEFLDSSSEEYWYHEIRETRRIPGTNVQFSLRLSPADEDENQVNFELRVEAFEVNNVELPTDGETSNFKISYKVSISSVNYNFEARYPLSWGRTTFFSRICAYDELIDPRNNYFVNDTLIITMQACMSRETQELTDNNNMDADIGFDPWMTSPLLILGSKPKETEEKPILVNRNLGLDLWNRNDKDFAFVIGRREIKVHKFIIADCEVFNRMLESGLQESQENKVTITDFCFETVEIALKYFYGLEIGKFLTIENSSDLIRFSDKYDIDNLKTSIENFLSSQISKSNICQLANFSIFSNLISLRQRCFDYLLIYMNQSMFVKDLDLLNKDFAVEVFKARFYPTSY